MNIEGVLFDFDGTLADTAHDLSAALNAILEAEGRAALPYATSRPWVSFGGRYMIQQGFGFADNDTRITPLWQRFLSHYQAHSTEQTALFSGMETILNTLEKQHRPWGIVTNKPAALTTVVVNALGLNTRTNCVVSGDTLVAKKPHPLPMFYAADLLNVPPEKCLYIGDAERDIEAGKRAGMYTATALFGYIGQQDNPTAWNADVMLDTPLDLLRYL